MIVANVFASKRAFVKRVGESFVDWISASLLDEGKKFRGKGI